MVPSVKRLRIPLHLWQAMQMHVQACLPEEACGLLGGRRGVVSVAIPVENVAHSPVRYRMEPQAQVRHLLELEAEGLDLLAIYHSHPHGPPTPSETDRQELYNPGTPVLVWCSGSRGWHARAFDFNGPSIVEVTLEVDPAE